MNPITNTEASDRLRDILLAEQAILDAAEQWCRAAYNRLPNRDLLRIRLFDAIDAWLRLKDTPDA